MEVPLARNLHTILGSDRLFERPLLAAGRKLSSADCLLRMSSFFFVHLARSLGVSFLFSYVSISLYVYVWKGPLQQVRVRTSLLLPGKDIGVRTGAGANCLSWDKGTWCTPSKRKRKLLLLEVWGPKSPKPRFLRRLSATSANVPFEAKGNRSYAFW